MMQYPPPLFDKPNEWATLEDFTDWYLERGTPLAIPFDAEIYHSDDAIAVALFRSPPYQAELYLLDSTSVVPAHEHPYIEVLQILLKGGPAPSAAESNVSSGWGLADPVLVPGVAHGSGKALEHTGFVLLVCSKWPDGECPTSASVVWKGQTVGPKHVDLILRYFPKAYVNGLYVDVTQILE